MIEMAKNLVKLTIAVACTLIIVLGGIQIMLIVLRWIFMY